MEQLDFLRSVTTPQPRCRGADYGSAARAAKAHEAAIARHLARGAAAPANSELCAVLCALRSGGTSGWRFLCDGATRNWLVKAERLGLLYRRSDCFPNARRTYAAKQPHRF
jgi:hypothetical protein